MHGPLRHDRSVPMPDMQVQTSSNERGATKPMNVLPDAFLSGSISHCAETGFDRSARHSVSRAERAMGITAFERSDQELQRWAASGKGMTFIFVANGSGASSIAGQRRAIRSRCFFARWSRRKRPIRVDTWSKNPHSRTPMNTLPCWRQSPIGSAFRSSYTRHGPCPR